MTEYTIQTNDIIVAPSSVVTFKECHDCEIYIFGFTNEFAIEMNIDLMMIMPLTSSLHSQCVINHIGDEDIEKIHSSFASQLHEYTTTYQNSNPNMEMFREYIIRHMFASMIYRVCQMVAQRNAVPFHSVFAGESHNIDVNLTSKACLGLAVDTAFVLWLLHV